MSTWTRSTARIVWACAARNCRQVGPERSGVDAGGVEDRPDGGGGDAVVESDELAVDASVAPGGVLAGHLEYQRADRLWGGWAAWLSSRVGPAAGDELGVPAQQGSRGDEPNPAQRGGEQSAQRAEDGAVDPVHRRVGVASTQDGDLVTEHQDLDVLGCIRASEQRQPAQQTGEEQIGESEGHSRRSCCAGCGPGPRGRLSEKALVRRHDTVLGTHTVAAGTDRTW